MHPSSQFIHGLAPGLPWRVLVGLAALALACPSRRPHNVAAAPGAAPLASTVRPHHLGDGSDGAEIDLIEALRNGSIDTAGPVVDLGEPQAAAFIVGAPPPLAEALNGNSWAAVGSRLRLRLPLTPSGVIDDPTLLPTAIRLRVRHATARSVAVIADGLLVRTALLPSGGVTATLSLAVPPDRFRAGVTDLEFRFIGPRSAVQASGASPPPSVEIDWIQLARTEAPPALVNNLVSDVRVEATPRRALTLYPPSTVSVVRILPPGAVWHAALAAESPQGGSRAPALVIARLRAESDGADPVESRTEVSPNTPWQDVSLDLRAFAGRPVRLSVSAEGADARLAVASPRIVLSTPPPAPVQSSARHVVLVVLRGARLDRFVPALSPRLSAGGFARLLHDGVVVSAGSPATREYAALVSATTGLAADLHRMLEPTDLLDDDAPTMASTAAAAGVATRAYTDDAVWLGSGADRGFAQRVGCPADAATCRPDGLFVSATEDILRSRDRPSLSLIVTRAGLPPFDPAPDVLATFDAQPYEGTMTPAQSAALAARVRRPGTTLAPRELDRLELLYDAALLGIDRALRAMLDRLRDQGLDGSTLVIVVGDRGSALDEDGYVGEGPATLGVVSTTVLLARGPGASHGADGGVAGESPGGASPGGAVGVIDAAATALAALGVTPPPEWDALPVARARARWGRALPVSFGPRGEPGVRFGELLAMARSSGIGLYDPIADPLGATDLAGTRPVAVAFAQTALAELRAGTGDRRIYQSSTRVLPPAVEAAMHPSRP